jgi:predicted RNA binding protein YcfA (HicA-like mRNA interferase family)
LPHDFYEALAQALSKAGWSRVQNAKGSHEKWRHPDVAHAVIVPRTKSRHTANSVLKQAGLPKAF